MFFPNVSPYAPYAAQIVSEPTQQSLVPYPTQRLGPLSGEPLQNQQRKLGNPSKQQDFGLIRTWLIANLKPWQDFLGKDLWRHRKKEKPDFPPIQAPNAQGIRPGLPVSAKVKAEHPEQSSSDKGPVQEAETVEYLPRALRRSITAEEICFNPHLEAQEKENRRILAQAKFWDTDNLIDPFHELDVDEEE